MRVAQRKASTESTHLLLRGYHIVQQYFGPPFPKKWPQKSNIQVLNFTSLPIRTEREGIREEIRHSVEIKIKPLF